MKKGISYLVLCVLTLLLASSCAEEERWPQFEAHKWFFVKCSQGSGFVWIDKTEDKETTGCFYSCDEWPCSALHEFSVTEMLGKKSLSVDGDKSQPLKLSEFKDLSFEEYDPAPFSPDKYDQNIYRKPDCTVSALKDLAYGNAPGFYTSLPGYENNFGKLFTDGFMNSLSEKDCKLTMDVYLPGKNERPRPLILFIHGGAFCAGDKAEPAYRDFCEWFTSLGYVTASINYRIGFVPSGPAIVRSGYRAVQDGRAALRYFVHNASTYNIDLSNIFVAGSSAGAITALNMEFMNDSNRPKETRAGFLRDNLGLIDGSGNDYTDTFDIKAIASLWGGISDIDMLSCGDADIIMFHGDNDDIVPYGKGIPFAQTLLGNASSLVFDEMYGSKIIDEYSSRYGLKTKLHTFPGCGHALNVGRDNSVNDNHYVIRDEIRDFFFVRIAGEEPKIEAVEDGRYHLDGNYVSSEWNADGGFIIGDPSSASVKVLWRADCKEHTLRVCGDQVQGVGYSVQSSFPI